jgi:polar amino acid transport system substrate-binding protein
MKLAVTPPARQIMGQEIADMLPRLLLALVLLLPAQTHAQAPSLVTNGTVTFGLAATFPPFEYIDDGKVVGFDIDLANMLTKRMGLTATLNTQDFSGLIPAVLGRRLDAIISGMYINAERSQVVNFVPYLLVGNQIVVRKGNPAGLSGLSSLCGHRVATPVGTVFETSAKKAGAACVAAGKPELTLLSLTGTTTCALALSQDRAGPRGRDHRFHADLGVADAKHARNVRCRRPTI